MAQTNKKPADTKPLNMNIDEGLLQRIDKYRFRHMFASRTQAMEFLLEAALKLNPERPAARKAERPTAPKEQET